MKKALFLLLAVLLVQYKCDDKICDDDETVGASGVKDCENLKLDDDEYKCCFMEAEYKENGQKQTKKACIPLTKHDYDEIKDYIKGEEEDLEESGYSDVDISVDCDSNYIMISLLSLILLFL